jgi:hypothetical protein
MQLYEEVNLYESLWEALEAESESQPGLSLEPVATAARGAIDTLLPTTFAKQKIVHSTATSLMVVALMPIVSAFVVTGSGAAAGAARLAIKLGAIVATSTLVAKVLEAGTVRRLTRNFPGIKQLADKNPSIKREIYKLATEVGQKNAAKVIDSLEGYINDHPELMEEENVQATLELLYDPVEGKRVVDLALIATQAAVEELPGTLEESFDNSNFDSSETDTEEYVATLMQDFQKGPKN